MKEAFSFRENRVKLASVIRSDVLLIFFIVLSFSLMVLVSYFFVSDVVKKQEFTYAKETLNAADATIRSELREAEVTLLQVEMLIKNWLSDGESYEKMEENINMMANSMAADWPWVKGFINIYGVVNGVFFTGLYDTPPEDYILEEQPWYHTAEAMGGSIGISVPYTNPKTGKPVITVAKTMFAKNGKKYGIVALDVDFSYIFSYVSSLQLSEGGYGVLCDRALNYIVHPFPSYIGRNMEHLSPVSSDIAGKIKGDPYSTHLYRVANEMGRPVVVICKQLFNGWFLGIVSPATNYYSDVNLMALILSVLGFIFMMILSLILVRLSLLKARSDEQNLGKSSFLARMSHEIRTPMNSILGMAELIRRKEVSSDIQEYLEIIHQSGENLLAIINDILDFSKIESGRLQIQNHEYQIGSVINDMINMMRPKIAEKSLDFYVYMDSSIPFQLYGDDMRLRQILTNLLSNAIKYTPRGFVSLEMLMERTGDYTLKLICSVSDSGIGIKPEDRGRLFNEFVRVNDAVNQGIEGTGLGLVITNALCKAMGGEVTVSSEYGKGSTFRAVITQEIRNDKPVAVVNNPETKRVLFHDWRPQNVQSISNALTDLGVSFNYSQEFSEFIHDLEYGRFDYAFVTSKYAMDCIFALGRRAAPLQLVIMAEPGEMSTYQEVTSIMMPVFSIPLANILNNASGGIMLQDKIPYIKFTAPAARVLIVDDISTNLRVAKELMAPYNMNVQTCLSGSEALNLVKDNRFDLVFMDHMMPGMDGIEATGFIRGLETGDGYYENLPIIALTANAVSGQREMFLENDINDFLAKPIDIQKLNDILEQWLPSEKIKEIFQPVRDESRNEIIEPPVIEGVDVTAGLMNCNGKVPVYLNILEDFCNDVETRLGTIFEAFSNKDVRLYTTLVHAIKGAAMNIGAVKIGEDAFWLERTSPAGDFDIIKEKDAELRENLLLLINKIRAALAEYEPAGGEEHAGVADLKLGDLKKALSEMDIMAVNRMFLDYTGLSLNSKTREFISELEQLILMFEYDKAIEKIDKLYRQDKEG